MIGPAQVYFSTNGRKAKRNSPLRRNHFNLRRHLRSSLNGKASASLENLSPIQRKLPKKPTPIPYNYSRTRLVSGLAELGSFQIGDFTLASGKQSPLYVDLRLLVSRPHLMQVAARVYTQVLKTLKCDLVAGIPYADLPIGAAVSLASGIPLIYSRKEAKNHGLGKAMEGLWQEGDRVVIIEDVITTGGSILNSVELFRKADLIVEDAIVLLDRQQGGVEKLLEEDIRVHSVLELGEVLDLLSETGYISAEIRQTLSHSIANGDPI